MTSYSILTTRLVVHVRNEQLICSKVHFKLDGPDNVALFNFMASINATISGHVLLEKEHDLDILPTANYKKAAFVVPGVGSVFDRLAAQAAALGIQLSTQLAFGDSNKESASVFWLTIPGLAMNVLVTDKEDLRGKTIYVTDRPPEYRDFLGRNVVAVPYNAATHDVDDEHLGVNCYVLHDENHHVCTYID